MGLFSRLRRTLHLDGVDGARYAELDEEQDFHLSELARELEEQGLDAAAARREAARRFGNRAALRERSVDAERFSGLAALLRDARFGLRGAWRRRGLSICAVASLALGIGATTAVSSLVDAVLLHPLGLPDATRLVVLQETAHGETSNGNPERLADWAAGIPALGAVAAFYGEDLVLTGTGEPVALRAQRSVGRPLDVLGLVPRLGRGFTRSEELGEGPPVALLGNGAWRRRFGARTDVVGTTLRLGGQPVTIVGVLDDGLGYPGDFDVLLPAPPDVQRAPRRAGFLLPVARLRPGVELGEAQSEAQTVAARLAADHPATDAGRGVVVRPLAAVLGAEARQPLLVLLVSVLAVLAIACTNVASLLLARAVERRREAAVRVALGAGRASLVRLYLVESGVLAALGGTAGLLLAAATLGGLERLLPPGTPGLAHARLDGRMALFGLALSIACGAAAGLVPAWRAARRAPGESVRDGGRAGRSASGARARRLLVAVQVACTTALLVTVGLLGKSLWRMHRAPLGFEPQRALTLTVRWPWNTPRSELDRFTRAVLDELAALPGVTAAGMIDRLPLDGGTQSGAIAIDGRELSPSLAAVEVSERTATPGAFAALGVPLLRGRLARAPGEIVVNEALAARYFTDADALGRRLTFDTRSGDAPRWLTVVGVVANLRADPTETAAVPAAFLLPADTYWPELCFVVRTSAGEEALAPALRAAVRHLAPEQPIDQVTALAESIGEASAPARARLWLLGGFAGAALLLAAIGLYGLLASDVAERRREIGVRLALGAAPGRILGEVVARGGLVAGAGLLAGLGVALAAGRLVAGLLFEVPALDVGVLAASCGVLALVALAASFLPARRAALVDPSSALRAE